MIIVRYGEIAVKGKNRYIFENKLVSNLKNALKEVGKVNVFKGDGRVYIEVGEYDLDDIIAEARKVFGVFSLSPAIKTERDMDAIKEQAERIVQEKMDFEDAKTFKVESKRSDKSFKMKSPQISVDVAGYIYSKFDGQITANMKKPDVCVYVEVRKECGYVYADKIDAVKGLPLGTNGKAMVLLSGGIDSPVAAWTIAKRGVQVEAVHFHSYPFTNERSREKVKDLARVLSKYCGSIVMHSVNILPIQKEINANCPEQYMTILSRRFMMRVAERVARMNECSALITGESIGQVASQTIEGLNATNAVVNMPVFRPFIGTDKIDIIKLAEEVGTYEVSIIPEEDCCTVFLPKNPVTKPKLEKLEQLEQKLDIEALIEEVLSNVETERIEF